MIGGPVGWLLLFGTGLAAGTLNVIAGGGSLLSLPVLIFLGLPATLANGTNRVAILVQNVGAVWSFRRHGVLDGRWLRAALVPALLGAAVGAWLALRIGDRAFERILAAILVGAALWTVWNPGGEGAPRPPEEALARLRRPGLLAVFFGIGLYGGFVQAGVGFLILAAAVRAGLDLVRGNALKVLLVLAFTPLALAVFALGDQVDWIAGSVLAAGNLLGGLIGVQLSIRRGHRWIRRVVTVAIVAFAIALWV